MLKYHDIFRFNAFTMTTLFVLLSKAYGRQPQKSLSRILLAMCFSAVFVYIIDVVFLHFLKDQISNGLITFVVFSVVTVACRFFFKVFACKRERCLHLTTSAHVITGPYQSFA